MQTASRHFGLIATFAMLALLLGHASFVLHATSHDLADAAECELCISYANTTVATNMATDHGVLRALDFAPGWDNDNTPTQDRVHLARPRGPPSVN